MDPWEILFDDISLHRIVGEGAFGKVYSGELLKRHMKVGKGRKSLQRETNKEQQRTKKGLTVAVKMLQSNICLCQFFISYYIFSSIKLANLSCREVSDVFVYRCRCAPFDYLCKST